MFVISLSTIPPRFDLLDPTLTSLLAQKEPADRVILYIPRSYRRFPDWDGQLPVVPDGIEIRRVDQDLGPATKALCAAREFRGQDVDILFCDDDRLYWPGWTKVFLDARADHPDAAIAIAARHANELIDNSQTRKHQPRAVQHDWRLNPLFMVRLGSYLIAKKHFGYRGLRPKRVLWKRAGYTDLLKGFGGVMVRPEHFDDAAFDIPDVMWSVDDIWLSGMLAKNDVPLWTPSGTPEPAKTRAHGAAALADSVLDGAGRNQAELACVAYLRDTYGIWL